MDTKITLTPEQLRQMDKHQLAQMFLRAQKIEATFVVRRADGTIKYDQPELAGTYHEETLT